MAGPDVGSGSPMSKRQSSPSPLGTAADGAPGEGGVVSDIAAICATGVDAIEL